MLQSVQNTTQRSQKVWKKLIKNKTCLWKLMKSQQLNDKTIETRKLYNKEIENS